MTLAGLDTATIRERVSAILAQHQTPGAALGILHRGESIQLSFGVADATAGTPVDERTIFQCGSMTKTWTALAFLQLVDEGAVHLDEPVRSYLPGFRVADGEASARVTPRQLLNHTNGIEESYGDPGEGEDVYERMVENIADAPQVSPVGLIHGYSAALGYAILARIMEVIDGARWDTIMRDRLLIPLGAIDTGTRPEHVDPARAATGHLIGRSGPIRSPIDHLPRSFGPGGNLTSTVSDVLGLARMLLDRGAAASGAAASGARILSPATFTEMTTSRVPVPDPYLLGPEWALGIVVSDWGGRTVYGHDGSTIGQKARLRVLPDSDLALVLFTNGGDGETLYKQVFDEVLVALGEPPMPRLPAPDRTLHLDPSAYVGDYERPGTRISVTNRGGHLRLTLGVDPMQADLLGTPESLGYDLLPIDPTHFLMQPDDPAEETQTAALFDVGHDGARYLHYNARLHPRKVS